MLFICFMCVTIDLELFFSIPICVTQNLFLFNRFFSENTFSIKFILSFITKHQNFYIYFVFYVEKWMIINGALYLSNDTPSNPSLQNKIQLV